MIPDIRDEGVSIELDTGASFFGVSRPCLGAPLSAVSWTRHGTGFALGISPIPSTQTTANNRPAPHARCWSNRAVICCCYAAKAFVPSTTTETCMRPPCAREAPSPDGRARRRFWRQRWTIGHAGVLGELIAISLFCGCQILVSAGAGWVFNAARVPVWRSTTAS